MIHAPCVFVHACVCMCVHCIHVCACRGTYLEARKQLLGVSLLLKLWVSGIELAL